SLCSGAQVLTFRTRAWLSFAPPTCRMPLGQASGFSRTDPGGRVTRQWADDSGWLGTIRNVGYARFIGLNAPKLIDKSCAIVCGNRDANRNNIRTNTGARSMPLHRLSPTKLKTRRPGRYGDGGGLYLIVSLNPTTGEPRRSWLFRYERDRVEKFM